MAERELAFPSVLVDLSELSLPPMEVLDPGLGNLLGGEQFEFGLLSTTGLPLQMEDGLAAGQDDGMITPLFGDADLAGWIEGVCNPSHLLLDTDDVHHHQLEDKSYSVIVDQATTAKQAHSNQKLDMVPMRGSWGGCGQRKSRNKSASWKAAETSHLFGFLKPSACGDVNFGTRKKYSHWTPHEVEKLVDGLDEHGVGNWVKMKKTYFQTSPRTAMHLKDKWRGLCAACGLQVGSKQKVKAQAATREMLKGLENKIREIARKHNALED